jgi:hypothetical protein
VTTQFKKRARNYWNQWIKKRNPASNPQIFDSKNLYILPSGFGWAYGLVLLTLFSGAINYQISTIFLMTFLLAIIGLVSAWEAHANMKGLSIKLISIEDAQQGKPAQISLLINSNNKIRFGLEFQVAKQSKHRLEKTTVEGLQFIVPIETSMRGCFSLPPIVISSLFPFGIFRVWGYAHFEKHYYVYPEPISPDFWPLRITNQNNKKKNIAGDDELYELKQVENPWIQPNLIAWKIAAKGQGWYQKTMSTNEGDYWRFSLNDLPTTDLEKKLQHLSYWLQTAELKGFFYSIELEKTYTKCSQGTQHLQRCLRLLAVYQ